MFAAFCVQEGGMCCGLQSVGHDPKDAHIQSELLLVLSYFRNHTQQIECLCYFFFRFFLYIVTQSFAHYTYEVLRSVFFTPVFLIFKSPFFNLPTLVVRYLSTVWYTSCVLCFVTCCCVSFYASIFKISSFLSFFLEFILSAYIFFLNHNLSLYIFLYLLTPFSHG